MLQQVNEQLLLRGRVQHHLEMIYHATALDTPFDELADELLALMRLEPETSLAPGHVNHWTRPGFERFVDRCLEIVALQRLNGGLEVPLHGVLRLAASLKVLCQHAGVALDPDLDTAVA